MMLSKISAATALGALIALPGCAAAIGVALGGLAGVAATSTLHDSGDRSSPSEGASPTRHVATASNQPAASRIRKTRQPATTPSQAGATSSRAASDDDVRDIQRNLAALGYYAGRADGVAGPRTRIAIRTYQETHGLPVDGEPTLRLALAIHGEIERLAQLTHADADAGGRPGESTK